MSEPKVSLIVIAAPSGAGKSTLVARVLLDLPSLRFSVSHTTRPPRPGERDGVQYRFVDRAAFEALIRDGRLLEWAEVHGNFYGTSLGEWEAAERDGADLLLDLDVQGAAQVRQKFPGTVSVFVLPPSFQELERRLRGRGQELEEVLQRRLSNARAELRRYDEFDYVVVNDEFERCLADVKAVITAARRRRARMEAVAQAVLASAWSEGRG